MRLELKLFETVIVPSYINIIIYIFVFVNKFDQAVPKNWFNVVCIFMFLQLEFLLRFLLQLVLLDIFTLDAESVKPLPL